MKKYFLFLFIISIFLVNLSLTVSADNSLFIDGVSNYYNGEYKDAVNNLELYLNKEENNGVSALYYQTLAFIELNKVSNAKENIILLEDRGYSFGLIHWELGKLYLNKKGYFDSPFYNEARKELEKAIELGINSAGLHSDLAAAYQGLGNFEQAVKEYELAITNGEVLSDFINLATLYKETGHLDSALEIYIKAIAENPKNISIYLNMGDIYLEKEDYKKAINIMEKGIEYNNSPLALKTKLALAYYHNEDYQMSKKYLNEVISQNKNIYQAYYYLGKIYNEVEENKELAINYYQRAVNYNNNYVNAYLELGDIYLEQGKNYKAMAQYMKALEGNPNFPAAHYHLALAYKEMNMKDAAIEELRKTIHLDSSHSKAKLLLKKLQDQDS